MNPVRRAPSRWVACSFALASIACVRSVGPDGYSDPSPPSGSDGGSSAAVATGPDTGPVSLPVDSHPLDASTYGEVVDAAVVDAAVPSADGPSSSDGSNSVSTVPDGAGPSTPRPGDLLITEVMFEPLDPEPLAEWFEIYNASPVPELLSGLTIQDGYPHTHLVAATPPVVVPPQGYVVFVRDRSLALSNAIPADAIAYDYGVGLPANQGIVLEDGIGGEVSLWSGATLLADVPYGPWSLALEGVSIELAVLRYEGADQASAWCLAPNTWAAGESYGTPGAPNDCP